MKTFRKKLKGAGLAVLTLAAMVISVFPFYYMVVQSLQPWEQVDKSFLLTQPTWKSYAVLLGKGGSANPFMWVRAFVNSMVVSVPTALLSVAVGLMTGYASIKLRYKGKTVIYYSLLFQMFFPVIILLVPRYLLVKPFANSYPGMILPLSISVWAVFMYINYFKSVPDSVFESARIDGASEIYILYKIALPTSKSISIIVFLSIFMNRWCELMWDMLIAPDIHMKTLNVLISAQFRQTIIPGPMYAASVVLTLPVILLFLCFSGYFSEGINFMIK